MAHGVTKLSAYSDDSPGPASRTPKGWGDFWQKEMGAAHKRLRRYTKQGNLIVRRFLDDRDGQNDVSYLEGASGDTPFKLNFFHSNIVTVSSMLYGSTPKVEVSREHQDPDDDVARVASVLYQRILQADVEDTGDDLSTALKACLQDRLLPGLGIARVRYEFETEMQQVLNPLTMEVSEAEMLTGEFVPIDYVHWQDFAWGWSRTWKETPWLAFRSFLDKDEATKRFGKKKAERLDYKNQLPTGRENKDETYDTDKRNNLQKAEIWEIWQKKDKRVYWWSEGVELILDVKEDPLELDNFWPCPAPMMANLTTSLFVPKADYVINQDLYNEIDTLQSRIKIITRAIKVVGVYDKNAGPSVGRMLKEGTENDLIPVDNWAMFSEKGGLKGSIDWFPVQEIVGVLQTLQQVRGETIQLLYEVTGLSDLMRGGNTDQYTANGTQQLKAKFGSIQIQSLQDEFAKFASELDGLKAEVISKHYNPESIIVQSNAQFLPEADKDKIQPAIQLMQSPEVKWRINIRPESIAMVDYAQLKSERTEFLTAMSTYIQSASAAVQSIPGSLPILLELMKWAMAGFKGSNYLEGTFDQAIEMAKKMPAPGEDDGKQQEDKAKADAELQKIQAKSQADMQLVQAKGQADMQKQMQDHQNDMAEIQAKAQADNQKMMVDLQADLKVIMAKLQADLQVEQAQSAFAAAEEEIKHEGRMEEIHHKDQMASGEMDSDDDYKE